MSGATTLLQRLPSQLPLLRPALRAIIPSISPEAAMTDPEVPPVPPLPCRDQKGLVAAVSDFLYRNDGNIIHADQHTDQEEGVFLQRVEWELAGLRVPRAEIRAAP